MLAHLRVPLSWTELVKRAVKEAWADDVLNLAAQQAYYFFFALFPALLFVIAVASFFPLQGLIDDVVSMLAGFAPADVTKIITDAMKALSEQNSGGILTFGFLVTIWSQLRRDGVDHHDAQHGLRRHRVAARGGRRALTAIALTVGIARVRPHVDVPGDRGTDRGRERSRRSMHLGPAFKWAWWVLQWPVVFALVATGIGLVYYFAPDVEQDWVWITPGSILATVLWLVVSLGAEALLPVRARAPNAGVRRDRRDHGADAVVLSSRGWRCCSARS